MDNNGEKVSHLEATMLLQWINAGFMIPPMVDFLRDNLTKREQTPLSDLLIDILNFLPGEVHWDTGSGVICVTYGDKRKWIKNTRVGDMTPHDI